MIKLRRCPFCGGEAILKENEYDDYYIKRYYTVHCTKCSGSVGNTNSCLTKQKAIEAWNKRVSCDTCALYSPDDGCMAGLAEGEVAE